MEHTDSIFSDDDMAEGHVRLRKALGRLDVRSGEILASHIALEAEIDLTFEELFPNPMALTKLGFGNKVRVLQGVYDHDIVDLIGEALLKFDELRNSIAHRHTRADINAKFRAVCDALSIDKDTAIVLGIAHALTSGLVIARRELTPTK